MPFFTGSDGARLYYSDEGAGLPLLCLAGLTRTGGDFDYLAPHLPGAVRLIRPDYRGRGRSDWTGAATYTIAQEAADALALLDHLGVERAAVLGTSRGGLIAMYLAVVVRDRLRGICFNDIGPVIEPAGLARIREYVGRNPAARTHAEVAEKLPAAMAGFANVPPGRWMEEARRLYDETPGGLVNRYDPDLRTAFLAGYEAPPVDLWPAFDACAGLPLALIRGENSDLLSRETVDEMCRRRPDIIFAEAPDRAHIPFLDEAESLAAIHDWLGRMT